MQPWLTTINIINQIIVETKQILNSYIISTILDVVLKTTQTQGTTIKDIYPWMFLLISYNVGSTFLSTFRSYMRTKLRIILSPEMRRRFYLRLNDLGIQNLERPDLNNIINRAQNSTDQIGDYAFTIVGIIATFANMTLSLIIITKATPAVSILYMLIMCIYFVVDKRSREVLFKFGFDNTEKRRIAGTSAGYLERATDLVEISVTGALDFLDNIYTKFWEWYNRERLKIHLKRRVQSDSIASLTDIPVILNYFNIFSRLISKSISVGDALFQIRVLGQLENGLFTLVNQMNDLFEWSINMREAYKVFTIEKSIQDGNKQMQKLSDGPDIKISNIIFAYPNSQTNVFENLTINIKSGEKIAIVGHNGAGKTTLVKLLCRIYTPQKGEIEVNETNINDVKISSWYENMGVLFQEYNSYISLSVKENIAIGRPTEPIDEIGVRLAAMNADAMEFIESYPNKFNQLLSVFYKGGTRPSTGQWQKIAIARFFYRNAPFVIFDEPTAAIDAVSEYNIFNRIYEFFTGKTVIIISHRFSTVRNADRIIVLDKGQIIEQGSHNELMSHDGYYKKAFLLQAGGYQN